MPSPRTLGTVAVLALTLLFVSACAPSPEQPDPQTTEAAPTPTTPAPEPSSTPDPEPADADDPTCETLIGEAVIADFESYGWTVRAEPFYIGGFEVPGGLRCVWADFEGLAGDHGQMFGWAEISESDASQSQDELVSQGWIREDAAEGVYITESPDTAIAVDENGFGMTYLFGDGWVTFADTKQGLLLIEWPAS